MQTCSREAARAGKPRICERIGVRVLSARLQAAAVLAASSCAPRWCTAALSCLHFTHMGGQSRVHADRLKKRWGAAYPASVTPQAGERSAHLAAHSKL